jgi:hypothetical protein
VARRDLGREGSPALDRALKGRVNRTAEPEGGERCSISRGASSDPGRRFASRNPWYRIVDYDLDA